MRRISLPHYTVLLWILLTANEMVFSKICRMTYPVNAVNMVGKTSANAVQSSRHTHSIAILYSNSNVTAVKD